jgi:predicted metal-dependent HD superfamily phosphohydrolase
LIKKENISSADSKLLRVAALYHDLGFIQTYKDHEEVGVELLRKAMIEFGCDMKNFKRIASMIMATKIPQSPKNILEKIICDSDLFYLGKSKYYEISDTLYKELLSYKLIKTKKQWMDIQINFLSSHHYHTKYCKENLEHEKQKRVKELMSS